MAMNQVRFSVDLCCQAWVLSHHVQDCLFCSWSIVNRMPTSRESNSQYFSSFVDKLANPGLIYAQVFSNAFSSLFTAPCVSTTSFLIFTEIFLPQAMVPTN